MKLACISAVSSDDVLESCLKRSRLLVTPGIPLALERGHASAGKAYNAGLARTEADYIIFAHQDVYFPADWLDRLQTAIGLLETRGEPWGVLGVWGVTPGQQWAGRVWCSGGGKEHRGTVEALPAEVASIDEIVIVLNRKTGLRFDEDLPGFHLYATDIILQARAKGYKAFVFDGPVVHNSRPNPNPLDAAYFSAYRYMQRKWKHQLPVQTCVVPVTRWGWPLYKRWGKRQLRKWRGRGTAGVRLDAPQAKAAQLGYE